MKLKILSLGLTILPALFFSQSKKKLDVVPNVEAKIIAMKAIGDNYLAKSLEPFYGFGFGVNLMTPINFGVGLDYNVLFSNVKDRYSPLGNIGSPTLTNIDLYLTHRDRLSEDFFIEEMAGFSYYNQSSILIDQNNEKLKNNAIGFNLGGKFLYTLDRMGYQQVFLAAKMNLYYNSKTSDNLQIQDFNKNSTLLSLGLGYRYNF